MTIDKFKGKYRIPSARLTGWDYTSPGYYFITICIYDHQPFFGQVMNGQIALTPLGDIAREYWLGIPTHSPRTDLDAFVIMPNHMHGIVVISTIDSVPSSSVVVVETQHAASLQTDPASL